MAAGVVLIYGLCEPGTNLVRYVGKTIHLKKRLKEHVYVAVKFNHKSHKDNWIRSLQPSVPSIIVLEECTEDTWQEAERRWIARYRKDGSSNTNSLDGGQRGHVGKRPYNRSHQAWNKGKKYPQEVIAKIVASHLGQVPWNKGVPWSEEVKKKLSESHKGLRGNRLGHKATDEQRARMSAAHIGLKSGNTGKRRTDEWKAKMSQLKKIYYANKKAATIQGDIR